MKGHAESSFWQWVCSWARACRQPSDLGFSDERFVLPKLIEQTHIVESRTLPPGFLYPVPAQDMQEERAERRRTINERCEKIAELTANGEAAAIWCHLNPEGNLLEKLVKDSVQVSGSDSDEKKEEAYEAFASGQIKRIITKPKIGAWGLNWQHCAHVLTFASHSYEQYYQLVRRCWRFGQKNKVNVNVVASEGEERVSENLDKKSKAAAKMFTSLVGHMNNSLNIQRTSEYKKKVKVPSWA